jgi:hypothetical protein
MSLLLLATALGSFGMKPRRRKDLKAKTTLA